MRKLTNLKQLDIFNNQNVQQDKKKEVRYISLVKIFQGGKLNDK